MIKISFLFIDFDFVFIEFCALFFYKFLKMYNIIFFMIKTLTHCILCHNDCFWNVLRLLILLKNVFIMYLYLILSWNVSKLSVVSCQRMISTKCFMTCNLTILKYFFEFFVDWHYDQKTFLYISIFFNDCLKYVNIISSCNRYWAINTKFIIARTKFRTLLHWMMKNKIIIDIICRTIVFCSTSIHCLTFENFWKCLHVGMVWVEPNLTQPNPNHGWVGFDVGF